MRTFDVLSILLSLFNVAAALPTLSSDAPLPLLIWHGLGDRYNSDGISDVGDLARGVHPNTYVYPIRLDDDGAKDQRGTFFGNVTAQIDDVCSVISADPILNSTRVDALGFSQGGQFLRGLLQRCPAVRVRSLVTYGSQHNGIAKFQECGTWDLVCKGAIAAVQGNAWGEFVQGNIVPAQYYRERDPETGLGSEGYLNGSHFLADLNNEREVKNELYKQRVASLDYFVMYVFDEDTTVLPKESAWFSEVNATDGRVTLLKDRAMYKEDWLGLKKLDEKGALVYKTAPGAHMRLTEKDLKNTFSVYFGPERLGGIGNTLGKAQSAFSFFRQKVDL